MLYLSDGSVMSVSLCERDVRNEHDAFHNIRDREQKMKGFRCD